MRVASSAFYGDAVQLTWLDLWNLIRGRVVKSGPMSIALGRMPSNGCPCASCKAKRGE